MKYSILELDKIKSILKERKQNAEEERDRIFHADRPEGTPFFDMPGWAEADKAVELYEDALKKIEKYFDEATDAFIENEL
jgi:hypothetical protein